jgi:pseudaminic acid synthase
LAEIVAEMSGNHNGSLEMALNIVRKVAEAGAHYLKLQTYTADTITLPVKGEMFEVSANHELWSSKTLYDLYSEAHTPWEWHKPIFALSRELGIVPFSTPFDETAVEFLENLEVPIYKIASLEIVDIPLIRLVASTGKPMIISTGTASLGEIEDAVNAARQSGCNDLTLMLCTSSYPAKPEDAHLARIGILRDTFNVKVGLSDHTLGINVAVAGIALGVSIIEKHVTLDRKLGGVDSAFSLEPHELAQLVAAEKQVSAAIGNAHSWRKEVEFESLRHRPSIYITDTVAAKDEITLKNIRTVRPSGGIKPKYLNEVLGRRFSKSANPGTPLTWDMVAPMDKD